MVVVSGGAIAFGVASSGAPAGPVRPAVVTTTSTAPVVAAAPCPPASGATTRRTVFSRPPPDCLAPGRAYTARVVTDTGSFTIALDRSDPVVVNDFVYLARYRFYDGLIFHRVIPGFVVQGGDPSPLVPAAPQGPGYAVQGAVPRAGAYKIGTVAMAKTGSQAPGAAGSQFFVVVGAAGEKLPPDYSVLGQVSSGMSVVERIEASGSPSGAPKLDHYIISLTISSSFP